MNFEQPGIIIGAGRSGTNMLRDLLVSLPEFATWPCDEINYIWRHGNREFETDEFTRAMATDCVKNFIRKKFQQIAQKNARATIIEKTCANSLRCGFVHEIFPDAKFVHIIRDGRDVASSAAIRWNAPLDINYLLKKARFVPPTDLPWYAAAYLKARLYRTFSGKSRLSTWGPRYQGMQSVMQSNELIVACAIQWKACVESAIEQLSALPENQLLTVRYEAFTQNPTSELRKVCEFLGAHPDDTTLIELAKQVSSGSVGKWKSRLSEAQISAVNEKCGDLLQELGYAS